MFDKTLNTSLPIKLYYKSISHKIISWKSRKFGFFFFFCVWALWENYKYFNKEIQGSCFVKPFPVYSYKFISAFSLNFILILCSMSIFDYQGFQIFLAFAGILWKASHSIWFFNIITRVLSKTAIILLLQKITK